MDDSLRMQNIAQKFIELVDGKIVVTDSDQLVKELFNEVGTTPEDIKRCHENTDAVNAAIANAVNALSTEHMTSHPECNEHTVSVEVAGKWLNIKTERAPDVSA